MFRFVAAEKANHKISTMCRVLEVSRQGFYAWERRAPCDRALSDAWLTHEVRRIHAASRCLYGSPRIHAELAEEGVRVGRKRVERLMAQAGIEGAHMRRRAGTTVRVPGIIPADDLVQREFCASEPNQLVLPSPAAASTRTTRPRPCCASASAPLNS